AGGIAISQTPAKECDGRTTMNFYIAGIRAATEYNARQTIESQSQAFAGEAVRFTTGIDSMSTPLGVPLSTPVPKYDGILLQSIVNAPPLATDLDGNLVWYGPSGLSLLTRVTSRGTFLGIFEDGSKERSYQIFREFDAAGVTLAETNAQRV